MKLADTEIHAQYGKTLVIVLLALVAMAAGSAAYLMLLRDDLPAQQSSKTTIKSTSIVGSKRVNFTLSTVENEKHSLSDYDGKVIVLNFWATWCPPCRREIPALINVQDKYQSQGFSIVGVALDTQQAAIDYVDPMGINYPVLVGETEGIEISQQYGNQLGVLPYTVIIDRKGVIQHAFAREVTFAEIEALIQPLL